MFKKTLPTKSYSSAQFTAIKSIILYLLLLVFVGCTPTIVGSGQEGVDSVIKKQIKASTVHLEFIGKPGDNQDAAIAAQGLGTLVQINGRHFILTHNHWPMSVVAVDRLIIRNSRGTQILVLDRLDYLSQVCFRDKGTLLFSVPGKLNGLLAAEIADSKSLKPNAAVWVVSRKPNSDWELGAIQAQLLPNHPGTGPGTISLSGPSSAVSQGDSGGGIWYEGRLIGNLWAMFVSPRLNVVRHDSDHSGLIDYQPNGELLAASLPDFHSLNQSSPGKESVTCGPTTVPSGLIP